MKTPLFVSSLKRAAKAIAKNPTPKAKTTAAMRLILMLNRNSDNSVVKPD